MEQLAARRAHNPKVVGSNPTPATMHLTCKRLQVFLFLRIWRNWQTRTVQVRVRNHGGSNPFIRTKLCISELFVFRKTLFRICHYSRRCPVLGFFFFIVAPLFQVDLYWNIFYAVSSNYFIYIRNTLFYIFHFADGFSSQFHLKIEPIRSFPAQNLSNINTKI